MEEVLSEMFGIPPTSAVVNTHRDGTTINSDAAVDPRASEIDMYNEGAPRSSRELLRRHDVDGGDGTSTRMWRVTYQLPASLFTLIQVFCSCHIQFFNRTRWIHRNGNMQVSMTYDWPFVTGKISRLGNI